MQEHDTALRWRRSTARVEDPTEWHYDWSGNVYTATGACPVCHASDQSGLTYASGVSEPGDGGAGDAVDGESAPEAPGGPPAPDPEVEVDVECRCGPDHGEGHDGCGARWVVRIGDLL